jgi:hypothetical protein
VGYRHVQQFVTLGVNRPALVVGHIIIFQQLLTNIEVTALSMEDALMRIFASDRVSGMMRKLGMKPGEAIEHPWVTKATGIPLTTGTAAQLVIDTA